MDYLTILTTRAVAARPVDESKASHWYYHGTCLSLKRYTQMVDQRRDLLRFEPWHPGDSTVGNLDPHGRPLCDHCDAPLEAQPLEDLPC